FNGHQCKEKFSNLVRDYNGIEEHEEVERVRDILMNSVHIFGRDLKTILIESVTLIALIVDNVELGGIIHPYHLLGKLNRNWVEHHQVTEEAEELLLIVEEIQNTDHAGSVEMSSLQPPPPYSRSEDAVISGATDETQNNNISSEMDQSNVVSNHEDVSGNIPSSQNNSDVSIYDVDSQPLE
ncbi:13574_t:CDS:2, partial [Acaulospora morrowiae]